MQEDIIIAGAAIVVIAAIIIGFVRKFKNGTAGEMITDTLVDEVKNVVGREIADVLHNAGITTDYESFKDYVIKTLLKKARDYFDKKGGTIDEVTDAISDESIIDAINMAIDMSGMEDEIKDAYDQLVNARLQEIDESADEVEAENEKIENEDLSQYEEIEAPEEESEPEIKVDEE